MHIERYNSTSAAERVPAFIDLYAEVYGVPPYAGDPFFSVDMYAERLAGAMTMRGFEIVTATIDDLLVGIGHGVTLPRDVAWWQSIKDSQPTHLAEAAETGNIFWLRELQVRPAHRNEGIGRELHDYLRAGRSEAVTTMTVITDNEPARSAYLRWGYQIIGQIRHAPESPLYDAMTQANTPRL
jgi:GNAT superfamily N-acetyltransferase